MLTIEIVFVNERESVGHSVQLSTRTQLCPLVNLPTKQIVFFLSD